MTFSGRVSDAGLMARFRAGEELELAGAFSEGVYFTGPGGMVMLHDARFGALPFGVAVPGFSGRGRGLGESCGRGAALRPGGLSLPGAGLLIPVEFEPTPPLPAVRPSREELGELLSAFTKALLAGGRGGLLPYCAFPRPSVAKAEVRDEFARAGFDSMCLLGAALAEADAGRIGTALCGLLGLGRGLTPSFDDFVAGALYTLGYAAAAWGLEHPAHRGLAGEVSALAPRRTNSFSSAYLLAAASGGDFSLMRDCLELCPSSAGEASLRALLGVGGSSGADMLCGMAYALGAVLAL